MSAVIWNTRNAVIAIFLVVALIVAITMFSHLAEASVSCTNLTTGTGASASSFTTASISPSSNTLILATIVTRTASGDPNHGTMTGNGLTWVEATSTNFDNTGTQKRKTIFRALGTASAGTVAIDFAAQTQTDTNWVIDQCTGTDTSGTNGSGAIVQMADAVFTDATHTTATATLGAFSSTNNSTYGSVGIGNGSGTFTPGAGFSTVGDIASVSTTIRDSTEFQVANDTTVDFTSSIAGELIVTGIELKVAPTVTSINDDSGWWLVQN